MVSVLPKPTLLDGGSILMDYLRSRFSPMAVIGGSTLVSGCWAVYIGFIGGGDSFVGHLWAVGC